MSSKPWNRYYSPFAFAPDSLGAALPGATLSFYASQTDTPLATYSDADLTVPNPNPMTADANGVFDAIFLQSLPYKVVYAGPAGAPYFGVVIWTADPVEPFVLGGSGLVPMTFRIDGNGSVPSTGVVGDMYCPFSCDIKGWTLQADAAGNLVVDIWKKAFATNSPPTVANTITAAVPPTLTAEQQVHSSTLTGWTVSVAAGDAFRFNINSIATIKRVTLTLDLQR